MSINDDYSEFNDDNQDVQTVIDYVRQEFKNIFAKHKELVIKLGKAIENTGQKEKDRICQEIKAILREEIALGLISGRAIERYCLDEWKKKTKPKNGENDKLSSWIVTMWHFGHDSSNEYTGNEFEVAWGDGQNALFRIYTKALNGVTKIRKERQEYPYKRFDDAIDEKLPAIIKMRAPSAKDA